MAHVWDQIGSLQFIRLSGELDPPGVTLEERTRAGADGVAYKQMGSRGRETTLESVADAATVAAANALVDTYKSYQSTVRTITQRGESRTNYLILAVDAIAILVGETPVGGTAQGPVIVRALWRVRYAGT